MALGMIECAHCGASVLPISDGTCPNCRAKLVDVPAQTPTEDESVDTGNDGNKSDHPDEAIRDISSGAASLSAAKKANGPASCLEKP